MLVRPRSWLFFVGWSMLLGCFSSLPACAQSAWGLGVNQQGEIFFSDAQRSRIWLISPRGTLLPALKDKYSRELYLDQADNVFGEHLYYDARSSQWRRSLWELTVNEQLLEMGAPASPDLRLARDTAGNQFIVQSDSTTVRVLKRTPDGQSLFLAGGNKGYADGFGSDARFRQIGALTIGRDGTVYLVDADCVRSVAPSGAVTTLGGQPLAGLPHRPTGLLGIAVDEQNNVLVADAQYGLVRKIGPENQVTTAYEPGWFWQPVGVTLAKGELYVLTSARPAPRGLLAAVGIGPYLRVQKITAAGQVKTLATVWGPTTRLLLGIAILLAALFSLWRLRRKETLEI